eukprot:7977070-Pyramimonas_sp.AAC.1
MDAVAADTAAATMEALERCSATTAAMAGNPATLPMPQQLVLVYIPDEYPAEISWTLTGPNKLPVQPLEVSSDALDLPTSG